MKKWILPCFSLILLTGCINAEQNGQDDATDPEQETEPLMELAVNLKTPWAINKTDEEFYISERTGNVVYVDASGNLSRQTVNFSSPLSSAAEAGFLGFVLAPDFNETNKAYAYYVYEEQGQSFNRIAEILLDGDSWSEGDILLDNIPTGAVHHGGRLVFDEDGILFATVGDASNPGLAQDPDSINGKILKLSDTGEFEIYSSGHRNPQGITWDDDQMYASEHGQSQNDEINLIEEGNNYGWPIIEGNEEAEGLESPVFTTGTNDTWAPSGIAVHDGNIYVASLRGTAINVINLESRELIDSIDGFGRVRDIHIDDGALYFITNNTDGRGNPSEDDDKLYRLEIGR